MSELFFNFHENNRGITNPRELFIFGDAGQSATVKNGNGFNETVTLNSEGFAIVEIPVNQGMSGTGVNDLGFQITSDDAIQAYFSNRLRFTSDLTIVFEKSSLGTEYVLSSIGSAFGTGFGEGGQFSVQATEDNTTIDITLPDGQKFSQTINAGETFKFATGVNNSSLGISIPRGFDLTGTLIKTTAPAAVFSGHSCTQIGNRPACDHIVEQMPPVDVLSNSYIVGEAFKNGLGDNLVRVVAAKDNTQVTLDGSVVATLNAGQSFDFTLSTNAAQITTSEPALVAQYLQSQNLVGEGDPAMMFVPGQDAWLKRYKLAAPADSAAFEDNLVNVVIPTTALGSLELNGAAIDTSGFVTVRGSGFSVGNLEIAPGLFTIEASQPFQVSLFGFDSFDSYLTFGAATFAQGVSNRPPVDILLSNADIDENSSNNAVVGNLTTTDPDEGDTHTYTLIDDAGGRFAINGNQLVVADGSLLDFETDTSHSIAINTQDAGGLNYQETFTIAINDVNETPVAVNDTATTDEDNSVAINVLANDTDEDGDTLSITGVSGSTGSVTIDGENIIYNPDGQFESLNAGETATDTFTYTVSDGNGLNDSATVTVSINGVDTGSLVQVDSEVSLLVDVSGSVSTSEYIQQIEGYAETFENPDLYNNLISQGIEGQVSVNMILWSSSSTQQESIGWTLIDSVQTSQDFATDIRQTLLPASGGSRPFSGGTSPGPAIDFAVNSLLSNQFNGRRLTIDVSGDGSGSSSRTSTARDNALAAGVDVINGIVIGGSTSVLNFYQNSLIGGTNADGNPAFALESSDFNGFKAAVNQKLTTEFTPPPQVSIGDISFLEGNSGTTDFIFDVTLSTANDQPITVDYTTADGTAIAGTDYTATNGTLTFNAGETSKTVTVSVAGENRVELDENFFINLSNVTNGDIVDAQGEAIITNDDEIQISNNNVDENSPNGTAIGDFSATDASDTDSFSFSLLDDAQGRFTLNGSQLQVADGTLLDFESNTSHNVTVRATDSDGNNFDKNFVIVINDIDETPVVGNEPPVANNDTATTDEDNSVAINVLANDTDENGDTLTITSVTNSTGSVTIDGENIIYNPNGQFESLNAGETATDSFTYTVSDGNGLTDTATVTVTINGVDEVIDNQAPVANNDTATTDEDNSVTINVLANDTDENGDTLTITGVSGSTGSVTIDGDNIVYNPNGQFESLNAGETATDSFSYTVSDGNGLNDTATVTVTINGVDEVIGNENPVLANNNGLTVDEDAVGNITSTQLQVTDADNSAAEITYTITDITDNGNLFLDGNQINFNDTFTQADIDNNRLTYDHDGSETTSDSFNFTVADGVGGSIGSSMFDITVNPVNDAPVANNDTATTNQNQAVTISVTDLLANDTDAESDSLSITSVDNAANGSVALDGNNVVFTPDNDFSGAASFEYTLSDGSETDNATVSITVNSLSSTEILGTPGRDTLTGDSADNIIKGFQGRDMLTGNGGADQFVYTDIRDAGDIITYFELGSDKIVLTQLLDSFGYQGSDAIGDGYVSFGSSNGDAFVQIDRDGMGSDFISRPLVLLQGVTEENLSANTQNSFVF